MFSTATLPTQTFGPSSRVSSSLSCRSLALLRPCATSTCFRVLLIPPSPGEDLIMPARPLTPSGCQSDERGGIGSGFAAKDDKGSDFQTSALPSSSSSSAASEVAVRKVGVDGRPMTTWGGASGGGHVQVPAPVGSSLSSMRAGPAVKGSRMCLYEPSPKVEPKTSW
jgi:hypothetical protein